MESAGKTIFCKICGRRVSPNRGHYIVRIEVFASDDPPDKLVYDNEEHDFKKAVDKILAEISETDPQEIEDSVYKFFKFDLCRSCQREYLRNPLGNR